MTDKSQIPTNNSLVWAKRDERVKPTIVPDDFEPPDHSDRSKHPYPPEYEDHLGSLMITHDEILQRTKALAKLISQDFKGERPLFLCVLKGASMFFHHLLFALQECHQGFTYEFIRAQSYEGDSTTGNVKISGLDVTALKGKHVVVVEDIVDTGTTLARLLPYLEKEGNPKKLVVCTLLEKRLGTEESIHSTQLIKVQAKYSGFSIPNKFIIGYGMDYNELYRDLKDIWVISRQGIEFDSSELKY